MMRNIRKSLLLIADETAISRIEGKETAQLTSASPTCVIIEIIMQPKASGSSKFIRAQMQRPDLVRQSLRLTQLSMFAI